MGKSMRRIFVLPFIFVLLSSSSAIAARPSAPTITFTICGEGVISAGPGASMGWSGTPYLVSIKVGAAGEIEQVYDYKPTRKEKGFGTAFPSTPVSATFVLYDRKGEIVAVRLFQACDGTIF